MRRGYVDAARARMVPPRSGHGFAARQRRRGLDDLVGQLQQLLRWHRRARRWQCESRRWSRCAKRQRPYAHQCPRRARHAQRRTLLELGGGDVTVRAGRNIDGGVYYVERGTGVCFRRRCHHHQFDPLAFARAAGGAASILPEDTWLPTTLFVGKSSFDVSARGDVLLGPVANTFLLPQGVNNKHWYKTYFSTYAASSGLGVTFPRRGYHLPSGRHPAAATTPESILSLWMKNELLLSSSSAANYQPWLRLIETNVDPFGTLTALMPGTLRASAYSGDINLVGRMTFSPSPTGTLELLAGGCSQRSRPTGVSSSIIPGGQTTVWTPPR
jgi:filamentous hemagglutinin